MRPRLHQRQACNIGVCVAAPEATGYRVVWEYELLNASATGFTACGSTTPTRKPILWGWTGIQSASYSSPNAVSSTAPVSSGWLDTGSGCGSSSIAPVGDTAILPCPGGNVVRSTAWTCGSNGVTFGNTYRFYRTVITPEGTTLIARQDVTRLVPYCTPHSSSGTMSTGARFALPNDVVPAVEAVPMTDPVTGAVVGSDIRYRCAPATP